MPIPAALPAIGAAALKWLPAVGAIGGAIPGLRKGNLGEAALGAGMGAATGYGTGGGLAALTKGGVRMAGGLAPNVLGAASTVAAPFGLKSLPLNALGATGIGLQNAAQVGIPLAGAAGVFGLSGGLSGIGGQGANRGLQAGSGIIGYNSVTGEPITAAGAAVPPGLGQFGGTNMYGSNPYDVIDPAGAMAANRLMSRKQAELARDNLNTIAPTQLKWFEETKRRDLERQLASAGIRQNIITQAQMLNNAQTAGLNQATTALQQVGGAMANNYSYS